MNFMEFQDLVRLSNTHYTKDFKLKILSVIEKENLSLKKVLRRFNIPAESRYLSPRQRNYKKNGILIFRKQTQRKT